MKSLLIPTILLAFVFTGCASITDDARKVMVLSQMSTLVEGCKKLGPVTSEVQVAGKWSEADALQQAKNNLRDEAAKRYQADTVVVLNSDQFGVMFSRAVEVQGMAFKCNP